MLKSINIGTTGLVGFSKELQTISNNVANLNTTGFKGTNGQFTALFTEGGAGAGTAQAGTQGGAGLGTLASTIDFSQGQINQTGSALDVAIDGEGFFVLKDLDGNYSYTRDGRFHFDDDILVNPAGQHVQALGTGGTLQDVTLSGVRASPPSASSVIKMGGILATSDTVKTVGDVKITDSAGGSHTLAVEFKNNTAVTAGSWLVTIKDGTSTVATGELRFDNGILDASKATIQFSYAPAGVAPLPLRLEFASLTTSAATGSSTMALNSTDGWGVGTMTGATFNAKGQLAISYTNGQTSEKQTLALARFGSTSALEQGNGSTFRALDPRAAVLGSADGKASTIRGESLEGSNVDLSKQFSAIIITQRGYQASSELISTANQMMETLMQMKR